MRRAVLLALALALAGGCRKPQSSVRAWRAADRTQLPGGPAAVGDTGDFVLENDQVRFVVLDAHGSPGPGVFGGSIADADLQRSEPEYRGGRGLDAFSELFPFANLATPAPAAGQVRIRDDGDSGEQAEIEVIAGPGLYMEALQTLSAIGLNTDIRYVTTYTLRPGERVLRIRTSLEFDNPDGEYRPPAAMEPLASPPAVFDLLLAFPPAPQKPAPGAVAGDFLFFGNKTKVFAPGYGFDLEHKMREVFNGGCDSINVPVGVEALAAEADHVSYAYSTEATAPDGPQPQVWVPLFATSFTAVMTHKRACPDSRPCLGTAALEYSRLFAVGDGDAASALREIYRAKGVATGEVRGHVRDAVTGAPVSGARVLVLRDPGPQVLSDADLADPAVDAVARAYEANRAATRTACAGPAPCEPCSAAVDAYGEPGIVTSMKTDPGTRPPRDGRFSGALRPGAYLLVTRDRDRATSRPVRVQIEAGRALEVELAAEPPAELVVQVADEAGREVPAKVTVGRCLAECSPILDTGGEPTGAGTCPAGQRCDPALRRCFPAEGCGDRPCGCEVSRPLDVALGDPLNPDNIFATGFTDAQGRARLTLRPGDYELVVSRGFEYDIDRHRFAAASRRPARVNATVHRVVDTTGWISADFHVHGMNSHDAYVTHENRVLSMIGEGVELVSSADHDALTDFWPAVRALRAQRFLRTQVGLETTSVEMGHFIGHPLRFDALFHADHPTWRGGAFDWYGMPAGDESFCDADGDGAFDPYARPFADKAVPYGDPGGECARHAGGSPALPLPGIFTRLRGLGLYGPEKTVVTVPHPRDGFFGYFEQFALDAYSLELGSNTLETFNPLIQPHFFSTAFDAIELFNAKRLETVRTPTIAEIRGFRADMDALRAQALPTDRLEPLQAQLGDRWIRRILRRTPEEQARIVAANGNVSCQPVACREDGTCGGGLQCDAEAGECFQPCGRAGLGPCPERLGTCDTVRGRCVRAPDDPCTEQRGVVDDWFRMLNAGVQKTGLGNSDTHTVLTTESGMPRNFVRSRTDEPRAIDLGEISDNLLRHEAVASYGPFVTLEVSGVGVGGTLTRPQGPLRVRATVEGPPWFDVDRLEVYRNGALWREVEAGTTAADCAIVDGLPNRRVVHFDCTFEDSPAADAWYVASALGLRGRDLRPVYSSVPILFLEIGDITGRAFGAFGLPVGMPEVPRVFPVIPIAYTNPVWVDLEGDGFDAPASLAPASPFSAEASRSFPLSGAGREQVLLPEDSDGVAARAHKEVLLRLRRAMESHHVAIEADW